jgi:hypothetical protein
VDERVPNPFNFQFTAVLALPVTLDVNCCICAGPIVTVAGEMVTPTGVREIVAVAEFVEPDLLVAVTITV